MKQRFIFITIALLIIGTTSIIGIYYANRPSISVPQLSLQIASTNTIIVNNDTTLVRQNGIWYSRDDDFYPVNSDIAEKLLNDLQQALTQSISYKDEISEGGEIIIKTSLPHNIKLYFNAVNGQTDEMIAVYNSEKYLLRGNFQIPSQPYQWFIQPLIPLSDNNISEIYGIDPSKFSFSQLFFYQATKQNDFKDWDRHNLKIMTTDGIIVNLTVYMRNHSYWASVDLQTSVMPTLAAAEYVKNNGFLYSGWFFELPQPEGNRLFSSEAQY